MEYSYIIAYDKIAYVIRKKKYRLWLCFFTLLRVRFGLRPLSKIY